jgi:hypothetical protein
MDAESGNRRTAAARWQGGILGIHIVADFHDAPAGARPRNYAPRDRGTVEFGKQRLVVPKGISLVRIGLRAQAPSFHEPCDAAMNPIRDAGNFGVTRRGHTPEYQSALAVDHIDAIQGHYVGFPTMSTTVAGTALIGLLRLFGVDIVQHSPFCRN